MKVYSFFGPPGTGKGTIAQRCVKDLGYVMLSTGDLARNHIQEETDLGLEFKTYVNKGHMIPDELITKMVFEWLKPQVSSDKTVVLDGFPRTKGQAVLFMKALKEDPDFASVDFKVVNFDLDIDEIVKRISSRLACSNKACREVYNALVKAPKQEGVCDLCGSEVIRRKDDAPEVVLERLKIFNSFKDDLLDYYESTGVNMVHFDIPEGGPEEVYSLFSKEIFG